MCGKCGYTFWGSKVRVKEHLRGKGGYVLPCSQALTDEEKRVLERDDAAVATGKEKTLQKRAEQEETKRRVEEERLAKKARAGEAESSVVVVQQPQALSQDEQHKMNARIGLEHAQQQAHQAMAARQQIRSALGSSNNLISATQSSNPDLNNLAIHHRPQNNPTSELNDTLPAEAQQAANATTPAKAEAQMRQEQESKAFMELGLVLDQQDKAEAISDGKQRKRQVFAQLSPFPSTDPPPNPSGWQIVKDPRDPSGKASFWAAAARNEVEALSTVIHTRSLSLSLTHTHTHRHTQTHTHTHTHTHTETLERQRRSATHSHSIVGILIH